MPCCHGSPSLSASEDICGIRTRDQILRYWGVLDYSAVMTHSEAPLEAEGRGNGAGPSSLTDELSEYEKQRLANIERNKRLLELLGLGGDGPGLGTRRPPASRDPFTDYVICR